MSKKTQAYSDGYNAIEHSNPHPSETQEYTDWEEGFTAKTSDADSNLDPKEGDDDEDIHEDNSFDEDDFEDEEEEDGDE